MSKDDLAATIATGILIVLLVFLPVITEWIGYPR